MKIAGEHNIDGWDGYYATVARKTDVETVLTVDTDFARIDRLDTVIPLSKNETNLAPSFRVPKTHAGGVTCVVLYRFEKNTTYEPSTPH